jgi:hypothetical protein
MSRGSLCRKVLKLAKGITQKRDLTVAFALAI